MVKLSKETKQRLQQQFKDSHLPSAGGFTSLVIYLGFIGGTDPSVPDPSILSLL
ncbi:mitochondrial import receptor subunit TOM7 homolog [Rattus rattus]|uniref:mitochondrial import receptor subunit TOM7 homolog n=1 Tax=Rattus rattus TaxID=10117 RepID=UPI0013F33FB8|nr:mitochondrial import receptor subunit TOM7 homolog [Rattus rattus]